MRTIIAGSRSITDSQITFDAINWAQTEGLVITTVLCGGAQGPDTHGEMWAQTLEIPVEYYPAHWHDQGMAAGYKRNVRMADRADALIAVWDGQSKGTKHMIDIAHQYELEIYIWRKK